ncbi:MAG: hypothetical protein JOZ78_15090 [Chroococcidiopsidaceae cyanobacterium CP_BM_ER_R8_30]|nr:hypothetical protein [Chroococcidiopsidaceae cyanobacterium CP_BM_ER_R8_30]
MKTRFNANYKLVKNAFLTGILAIGIVGGAPKVDARTKTQQTFQIINAKAIWEPSTTTVRSIQRTCTQLSGTQFGECFVNQMQQLGASPQAIAFTRSIGDMGYMIGFCPAGGPVSVAHVTFPFRANENQGAYLVNGTPARINVDDQSLLSKSELNANPIYANLVRKYSDILMFPEDRIGTNAITIKVRESGSAVSSEQRGTTTRHASCSTWGDPKTALARIYSPSPVIQSEHETNSDSSL